MTTRILLSLLATSYVAVAADFVTGQGAVAVIGQASFATSARGATASTFGLPAGVAIDPITGKLFVADRVNNRVLRYANAAALIDGAAAEVVFGQSSFTDASTYAVSSTTM
ncbi:MAG TPA: hypothetical protein VNB29_10725, partial [Chthoniobacterales bacterium]|nr:hypothetical protein [Chthoniobacterales bacterium]